MICNDIRIIPINEGKHSSFITFFSFPSPLINNVGRISPIFFVIFLGFHLGFFFYGEKTPSGYLDISPLLNIDQKNVIFSKNESDKNYSEEI